MSKETDRAYRQRTEHGVDVQGLLLIGRLATGAHMYAQTARGRWDEAGGGRGWGAGKWVKVLGDDFNTFLSVRDARGAARRLDGILPWGAVDFADHLAAAKATPEDYRELQVRLAVALTGRSEAELLAARGRLVRV